MPTMTPGRRRRGGDTQNAVARWFAGAGWRNAESAGAGRRGTDVTGMPGLHVEVKARRELEPMNWIRQAIRSADGDLPFVVWRPDGLGNGSIAHWPVMLTLGEFTLLLRRLGYGDPIAEDTGAGEGP